MHKILGIGHPRTGTGYTSKLLEQFGLNVGHEKLYDDGIVAWQWVLNHDYFTGNERLPYTKLKNPAQYEFETFIYNTRNPKTSISSIMFTENRSIKIRSRFFPKIQEGKTPLEKAILSITEFDKEIKSKYPMHFQYRIEDQQQQLYDRLSQTYELKSDWKLPSTKTNTRKHHTEINWNDCGGEYKILINKYCRSYGYDLIYTDL